MSGAFDISVVIPTFRRPALLTQTVKSVLCQTLAPREIIVVDDGGGEETACAMAAFGDRVRLMQQHNSGQQAARNRGVNEAKGRWIATLDDDDLYTPCHLANIHDAITGCECDMVYTNHRRFTEHSLQSTTCFDNAPQGFWDGISYQMEGWSFVGRFPVERLLRYIPFYPSTMTMRREFYLTLGGYDPQIRGIKSEDVEFLVRAISRGRLAISWTSSVDYRVHEGSSTRSFALAALGRLKIFEKIRAEHPLTISFQRALDLDIPKRRARALDDAYRLRDFGLVRELAPQIPRSEWTKARRAKAIVSALPARSARAIAATVAMMRRSARVIYRRAPQHEKSG